MKYLESQHNSAVSGWFNLTSDSREFSEASLMEVSIADVIHCVSTVLVCGINQIL